MRSGKLLLRQSKGQRRVALIRAARHYKTPAPAPKHPQPSLPENVADKTVFALRIKQKAFLDG